MPAPLPSSWLTYPTPENPSSKYKFASIEVNFTLDQVVWTRQTYSLLDWLGDLGGLYESLYYGCLLLVSPFTRFATGVHFLTTFFLLKS